MKHFNNYHEPLTRAVDRMALEMARPENVRKDHWNTVPNPTLIALLLRNLVLLYGGTNDDFDFEKRAANIANYAWMIADNLKNGKP